MKINYRTHPILEQVFADNIKKELQFYSVDKSVYSENFKRVTLDLFKMLASHCKASINAVSESFYLSAMNSIDKLIDLFDDINNDVCLSIAFKETFVFRDLVLLIDYFKSEKYGGHELMAFDKDGHILLWSIGSNYSNSTNFWVSGIFAKSRKEQITKTLYMLGVVFYMFKSYACVETKIIEPHSRIKDIGCKYINETSLPITYLDSKWFTNLVRSGAFKVRGHFRLQPKKADGVWTRELIWINDFLKTGYTSPAKILNK